MLLMTPFRSIVTFARPTQGPLGQSGQSGFVMTGPIFAILMSWVFAIVASVLGMGTAFSLLDGHCCRTPIS